MDPIKERRLAMVMLDPMDVFTLLTWARKQNEVTT